MKSNLPFKLISILLLLITSTLSAQTFTEGNLKYTVLSGANVSLTGYEIKPTGVLTISGSVTSSGTTYTVTSIGTQAFSNCTELTSVTIPNSVTSIGNYAFYLCAVLTSVTIPDSVTSIGDYAFSDCTALTNVTIPDSVTSIGEGTFYYCPVLESVSLPNTVTSIGDYAFFECAALPSITIPDSVTSIGDYAFGDCIALTIVTIPNAVSIIGTQAFSGCSELTSVTIPNSVTNIGDYAFADCSALTSVNVSWAMPLVINSFVFFNLNLSSIDLNVLAPGIVSAYQAASVWKDFGTITLGTNKYELRRNLKLYPNPVKDFVSISGLVEKENYTIYSVFGLKISSGRIFNNEKINTQNLANGIYFIIMANGSSLKFIKE